ncbi:hypothetical protein D9M71_272530 [compost metagenome]
MRIGVVEADEQHRNHPPAAVTHRGVLGHVIALEQVRPANIGLTGQQAGVGRMLAVEQRADGAAAVLLGQRGADTDKVFTAAHEQGGDARGHLAEIIHLAKVVVEQLITQVQRGRGNPRNRHRLPGMQLQTGGKALLEQAAQALSAFAQSAVKGIELIGEQSRFAGQVFLAGNQVGVVQRTQGKQGATGNHHGQHDGEGDTELRGNPGTGLRHGSSWQEGPGSS